jgi:hypothetical protein
MIESMLADSARVANMPIDAFTALCAEPGVAPMGVRRQLSIPAMRVLIAAADQFGWDDTLVETVRARGLEILVVCKNVGFSLRAFDAVEDVVGVLGPGERDGMLVPGVDEGADRSHQFLD